MINKAIREEFIIGPINLPADMYALFRDDVNTLLARSNESKIQQLVSIQASRDKIRQNLGLQEQYKDPMTYLFLTRERVHEKRRVEEDFATF